MSEFGTQLLASATLVQESQVAWRTLGTNEGGNDALRYGPCRLASEILACCLTDRASAAATCPFGHYQRSLQLKRPPAACAC